MISIETTFVAGDNEVITGNCDTSHDWDQVGRAEAQRIADGLGGTVVEETPRGQFTFDWPTDKPTQRTTNTELLKLAIVVDGRTVARVHATSLDSTVSI